MQGICFSAWPRHTAILVIAFSVDTNSFDCSNVQYAVSRRKENDLVTDTSNRVQQP
jgi:hypothetical protein